MRQDRDYFEILNNQIKELSRPSYYWGIIWKKH